MRIGTPIRSSRISCASACRQRDDTVDVAVKDAVERLEGHPSHVEVTEHDRNAANVCDDEARQRYVNELAIGNVHEIDALADRQTARGECGAREQPIQRAHQFERQPSRTETPGQLRSGYGARNPALIEIGRVRICDEQPKCRLPFDDLFGANVTAAPGTPLRRMPSRHERVKPFSRRHNAARTASALGSSSARGIELIVASGPANTPLFSALHVRSAIPRQRRDILRAREQTPVIVRRGKATPTLVHRGRPDLAVAAERREARWR